MIPTAFKFKSESDEPTPTNIVEVDDRLTADAALKQVRAGAYLLYRGDFHNAKQLVGAMGRRLSKARGVRAIAPREAYREERRARAMEHDTLSRVLVSLDEKYKLQLNRSPDITRVCKEVWGAASNGITVVSLKTLLGMMGAGEWRKKGVTVPGMKGHIIPHYGVYLPTRTDYVELIGAAKEVKDKRVLDVGTGTGVLGFLLLQRGAKSVVATDCDSRAIACATENARKLELDHVFTAEEADLFPKGTGRFDVIISNPPWIPEPPKNRVDKAVYDEGGRFVTALLQGASKRLEPGGELLLLISDLAVLLGLREEQWLAQQFEAAGLELKWRRDKPAKHGKAHDRADPVFLARSKEITTLYCLTVKA